MGKVLILGAGIQNKGAQAMVFQMIHQIKKHMPEKEIVVLNLEKHSKYEEFSFTHVEMPTMTVLACSGGITGFLAKLVRKNKSKEDELKKILSETDCCYDLSGFILSSQFGISQYLLYAEIKLMKKYNIPMVLMPQSFGPFNYPFYSKFLFKYSAIKYLTYPKFIYAREESSYKNMKSYYRSDNLKKSLDLVLLGENIERSEVYKNSQKVERFEVKENSVALIPNSRIVDKSSIQDAVSLYSTAIDKLLSIEKNVYVVRHSGEDRFICEQLKDKYKDDKVILVNEDMDCITFSEFICNFDFAISSRYHAIVHSLRNSVPCIAIGWADKYHEILSVFGMRQFSIDFKKMDNSNILDAIENMSNTYSKYKEDIKIINEKLPGKEIYSDVMNL